MRVARGWDGLAHEWDLRRRPLVFCVAGTSIAACFDGETLSIGHVNRGAGPSAQEEGEGMTTAQLRVNVPIHAIQRVREAVGPSAAQLSDPALREAIFTACQAAVLANRLLPYAGRRAPFRRNPRNAYRLRVRLLDQVVWAVVAKERAPRGGWDVLQVMTEEQVTRAKVIEQRDRMGERRARQARRKAKAMSTSQTRPARPARAVTLEKIALWADYADHVLDDHDVEGLPGVALQAAPHFQEVQAQHLLVTTASGLSLERLLDHLATRTDPESAIAARVVRAFLSGPRPTRGSDLVAG